VSCRGYEGRNRTFFALCAMICYVGSKMEPVAA
jgi:hypothetical protein